MENIDYGGHGGDVEQAAKQFQRGADTFIDFSSNINPFGPAPGLLEHLQYHLYKITSYPSPGASSLRKGMAQRFLVSEERVLIGNGANELIHLLFLYSRPKSVLLPVPTFSEYARAANLTGSTVRLLPCFLEDRNWHSGIVDNLHNSDFLVLCNPNNPTGSYFSRDAMMEVVTEAKKHDVTVLVDESFFPFTDLPPAESVSLAELDNLWVVSSLTKIWALPGLRLGVLIGPRGAMQRLSEFGDPWRVNSLAQLAGLYSLQNTEYEKESVAMVRREHDQLVEDLSQIPALHVFPGKANFLLLRGETSSFNAAQLYLYLGQKGFLIRLADNFAGLDKRYFRIAVRKPRENRLLIEQLHNYFSHYL